MPSGTEARMNTLEITQCSICDYGPCADLAAQFGKSADYVSGSRGIDRRSVQPDRIRNSVSADNTGITAAHLSSDGAASSAQLPPSFE